MSAGMRLTVRVMRNPCAWMHEYTRICTSWGTMQFSWRSLLSVEFCFLADYRPSLRPVASA